MTGTAVVVGTMATSVAAFGQDGSAPSSAVSPVTDEASDAPGEILVTARRREERLQDVPQSILAASGDALRAAGVANLNGLERIAPSVHIGPKAGKRDVTLVELRAIGTTDVIYSLDPTVGVYVNEVVIQRPYGFNAGLFDIESVQVLYGPQGTLFGRNTTGGAVLVTTKQPRLREFGGEVALRLGNYGRNDYEAVLNIPLGDTFAIRAAGKLANRRGYTRDVINGRRLDDENGDTWRLSALWEPSDRFSNLIIFDGFRSRTNGSGQVLLAARPANTPDPAYLALLDQIRLTGTASGRFPTLQQAVLDQRARGARETASGLALGTQLKTFGVSDTLTYEIGDSLTLKNIVSYRRERFHTLSDFDGSALSILVSDSTNNGHQVTEELQIQGNTLEDRLSYTVGGYYFREKGLDLSQAGNFTAITNTVSQARVVNKSASVYAQGTYRFAFLVGLSLTLGGRYTWDDRSVEISNFNSTTGICNLSFDDAATVRRNPCLYQGSVKFDRPTYNVSIDYKASDALLVYVAHRRGYRSGGINGRANTPSGQVPFRPETVQDIEIGAKSTFNVGDVGFRANLALYKTFYDDIQRSVARVAPISTPTMVITTVSIINAAKAHINGAEASLAIIPIQGLTFTGNLGIAHATYDNFDALSATNQPVRLKNIDFGNYRTTYNLGINYDAPLSRTDESIGINVNYSHHSKGNYTNDELPFSNPEGVIAASGELNASLTWSGVMGTGLSLTAFVENMTNNTNLIYIFSLQQGIGISSGQYNAPRMFGVEARFKF